MAHEIRTLLSMLVVTSTLLSACKQKINEEPEPAVVPSAAATAAPTQAPETPAPPVDTIPPPVQPPTPPPAPSAPAAKPAAPESIKACCAALQKEAATAADKMLYQTAATTCEAISKLVASGTTKKAAALTQLRASLKGGKLPAGCD